MNSIHLILHEQKKLFALDPKQLVNLSIKSINQSVNWFKRMQKCIDPNGEYIEKQ